MTEVDALIVRTTQEALSALVVACMDEQGKPKAPTKAELMKARAMLPAKFAGSLVKEAA